MKHDSFPVMAPSGGKRGGFSHSLLGSLVFLLLPVILVALAGCAPIRRAGQVTMTTTAALEPQRTLGQSLVAGYDGLMGVEVFIDPQDAAGAGGEIRFHLAAGRRESGGELAAAALPLSRVDGAGFYRFQFPPLSRSAQQDYYFYLELAGTDRVGLTAAPGDAYLDGSMYVDHQPASEQMAFYLVYDPWQMALGLGGEVLQWVGLFLAAAWLALPPGWALLARLDPGWAGRSWAEKLALAAGVSLALYPVLFLWTDLIGLRLGRVYAWGPSLLATAYLIWKNRFVKLKLPSLVFSDTFWPDMTLALALLMVFAARLWVIRPLDVGLWGDSYQHTMITQLIVDRGGLFHDWRPYADLTTFTYHFAFHAWAAAFHWVTGMAVPQAVVWVGQMINGLSVLALYPLALRLGRSRWAGAAAVVIAGLLMVVPMIYVNWGRYTQLAGQVILPVAVFLLWEWLDSERQNRPLLIVNWLLWAALGLAHYRVALMGLLFLPAYFLARLIGGNWGNLIRKTAWVGLGSAALFSPWLARVFEGKIMTLLRVVLQKRPQAVIAETPTASAEFLFNYASPALWFLLLAALAWGLWRHSRAVLTFFLWWAFIFIAANPVWLNLPGENIITDFSVGIASYILIAPLVGGLAGHWLAAGINRVEGRLSQVKAGAAQWMAAACVTQILTALAVTIIAAAGAAARANSLDADQYALLTRPDLRAFEWIAHNTTPESRFLVNAFLAYYNTVAAGPDGGWWLALLAQRGSTLPPMTQGFEQGPRPDYQQWNNQLVRLIRENGIGSDEVYRELQTRKITHVYVAQRHGQYPASEDLYTVEELLASPRFRPVYHQDRVWVFEVRAVTP